MCSFGEAKLEGLCYAMVSRDGRVEILDILGLWIVT